MRTRNGLRIVLNLPPWGTQLLINRDYTDNASEGGPMPRKTATTRIAPWTESPESTLATTSAKCQFCGRNVSGQTPSFRMPTHKDSISS